MLDFINDIKNRDEPLFYFGGICFAAAIFFLILTRLSELQVAGVNAWYKPFKFALSIAIYSWTMAWYVHYLPTFNTKLFNWTVIILLGFEIVYITLQAGKGQLSHFNLSTPLFAGLYALMALAATVVTIYTAYVGVLFLIHDFPDLPVYYLWSIRLGIIIFVIFSFEGFLMGSRLTHTIGGTDGGEGIPVLNWSTKFGDPRIAHFIGMHALQVLPFVSFYFLKSTKATFFISLLYAMLAVFTLVQALHGKPLFKSKNRYQNETIQ